MRIITKEVTVVIDIHEMWERLEDIEQLKALLVALNSKDQASLLDSFDRITRSDIILEEGALRFYLASG